MADRFLIAPLNSGLQNDLKPFLIPDDAYAQLNNVYGFRGRLRKRFGSNLLNGTVNVDSAPLNSRLRIGLGETDSSGNASGTVPGAIFKIGQSFSIGPTIFTVNALGTPADLLYAPLSLEQTDDSGDATGITPGAAGVIGNFFIINGFTYTVSVSSGALTPSVGAPGGGVYNTSTGVYTFNDVTPLTFIYFNTGASGTYDTTDGDYTFTSAYPSTEIYFYPSEPVMGFVEYENGTINDEPTYAFDTQFAYQYLSTDGGGWDRLGTAIWTGSNSDFFWGETWDGATDAPNILYVTNYNTAATLDGSDFMMYWDGSSWTSFNPGFLMGTSTSTILSARIIVAFKDRLVLLNIVENTGDSPGVNTTYVNRCRYSQNGSPIDSTAFYENVPGKGGFLDAPTKESIITAYFLKDRLIVSFQNSTWELAYTGNQILPFQWQKINTELGVESTFSVVPFDKVLLGIGNVGIHACNGVNVERIDEKIPTEVFEITNDNDGVFRVNGIRDYYVEQVYWAFPSNESPVSYTQIYPNRVLIYNYVTHSWAFNNDSITFFGYFQNQNDETWGSTNQTWEESDQPWNSPTTTSQFRSIIAGNQEGFTFLVDPDDSRNAPSLQITDITIPSANIILTVIDHNLLDNEWVIIENPQGTTGIDGMIFQVTTIDADTISVLAPSAAGTYTGGGTLARVSNIDIISKQYNFYMNTGRNTAVSQVNFYVDKTDSGQVTVDYFSSSSDVSSIYNGLANNTITGSSVLETSPYALYPLEEFQERLWHPVYMWSDGECVQFHIYMSPEQISNPDIAFSDFELNAMLIIASPTASRFQ